MSKRLTEELKDAVVADYLSGVTTREIIKKHKTYELYSILKERGIEYKQDNITQKERQKLVVDLYLNNITIDEIIQKTGYKDVYKILKKFNISRERNPKEYNAHKKEGRNRQLITDYLSQQFSIEQLSLKYSITTSNIYRILKNYNVDRVFNRNHHWVINQKVKKTPNIKCKFYILEDYYGYTKIGITTKDAVRKRYRKDVNVFYEIEDTIKTCYDIEFRIKKLLKSYIPQEIDKNIDGWSECYNLAPENVLEYVKSNQLSLV